jgi:hypothetical protein
MPLRVTDGVLIPTPAPAPAAFAPAPAAGRLLDVPLIAQEQNQWCWAGCAQMVAAFLGNPNVKQCELANFLHGQATCCQAPGSPACNRPSPVVGIGRVYQHLRIRCLTELQPVSAQVLAREINEDRPVEVGYVWKGGGGHVALVRGYTPQGLLVVNDPWFGLKTLPYLHVLLAYGLGRWAMTFGDFRSL